MAQIEYNIKLLREALNGLSSSSDEQLRMNKDGLEHLDDVFDPMPLDFLPWLEESGVVSLSFSREFRELYSDIDQTIGHLDWKDQDEFIANDDKRLQEWRVRSKVLLDKLRGL